MMMTTEQFKLDYVDMFEDIYPFDVQYGSDQQHFYALGLLLRSYASIYWRKTKDRFVEEQQKQVYYFSMEFLPGRQLEVNAYGLGILDEVKAGLEELGLDFSAIKNSEVDPALGNGGLGRLASAFMDSLAATDYPGNGNGIRYQYGLFRQRIIDGYQVELPENWLRNGNPWEIRNMQSAVTVRFGGEVELQKNAVGNLEAHYTNTWDVLAVPYDTPIIGYQNEVVNTLRLWSAEIPTGEEERFRSAVDRQAVLELSETLYPDDTTLAGKQLRIKQEYFMVSSGVQSILAHYEQYGQPIERLAEFVAIHINDTHPALVIPELMRLLMDERGLHWDQAWVLTQNVCSYTNHTILKEAMEKWPIEMLRKLVPRLVQIIEEIDRRHMAYARPVFGDLLSDETSIIKDGVVHMAHLAVIGSHSINGVAALHTSLLKEEVMPAFYQMFPNRFNNKTNGITQRRWLHLGNPELSDLLTEKIGTSWKTDASEMALFKVFSEDEAVLEQLAEIKYKKKQALAALIYEQTNITVTPDALFDVQIKRLHEYKRQLLNALHILDRYIRVKDNPEAFLQPRVFVFGAKAAPSYSYAKYVIKLINTIAEVVNNDPVIGDKIKVVFLENYNVSLAEIIIPAAEISEQISLASKEASGTGNMKMMLNGALTMATLDGANVEITERVGTDNIFLFGLTSDEVYAYYENNAYNPQEVYEQNPRIKRVLDLLIDGTLPGISQEGKVIYDSLVYNDPYFLLEDFMSYINAQERADALYQNSHAWNRSALINIACAGSFSSDDTIKRYAEEIWKLED